VVFGEGGEEGDMTEVVIAQEKLILQRGFGLNFNNFLSGNIQ